MEPQNSTVTVPLPWMKAAQTLIDTNKSATFDDAVQKLVNKAAYNYKEPDRPAPPKIDTTEAAAKLLVDCLEPEHRNLIYTLAKETMRPLAAYVMSPLLLARENGRVGVVIGKWADARLDTNHAPINTTNTCEFCRKEFNMEREGQRFCMPKLEDADSCGRQFQAARIKAALMQRNADQLTLG